MSRGEEKAKRWRLQFKLSTLLLFVTLSSMALAWLAYLEGQERLVRDRAVKKLKQVRDGFDLTMKEPASQEEPSM
jgi:hypothetical protein